ncbi:serine/threonine-protein kinase [Streptomyces marianii]|uniref:non-specific serine/threonine protein kinase n=1 Tax=Streptomyces marianii TaxID=1817406 RepID=A0A5R9DX12_9ACTN|nr:serine/threonine-protein kinase [Streptomyces marianii]TLQ42181.1 serine/threonine protein kinase [Streptomyces marianii]
MQEWVVPGYSESGELGSGSSGRVVRAVHERTGTPVAVKYLSDALRADPRFLREFRNEAGLLAALGSPYVVGLHEYVEGPQGSAIVMELVDGISLRALLRRKGATAPEAALTVLKGSLLGLAAAHRTGVIHRDYKPENVLVAADGTSKLVDFGIAVREGTAPGVAGTPLYMAPEQWNGLAASPATDVYAATATFYECLTGEYPYAGGTAIELAVQHMSAQIPADMAPEPVRTLIRRGLAKHPEQRPETAEAFLAELEEVAATVYGAEWEEEGRLRLAALAALLLPTGPPVPHPPTGSTTLATTVLSGRSGGRLGSGLRGPLAGAGVVLASVLAFLLPDGGDQQAAAESAATTRARPGVVSSPITDRPVPGSGSGMPSSSPSASTTASPSGTGSPSASDPPLVAGESPGAAGTPGADTTRPIGSASMSSSTPATTKTAPPPASSTLPAPPAAEVTSLSVATLRQSGLTTADASIVVGTSGTGPVTLTVAWHASSKGGTLGAQDGASQTFRLSGEDSYTVTASHDFRDNACYWGVAAASPASAAGDTSRQIVTQRCDVR